MGVKKGNQELLDQINTFIDEFYAQNGFDSITEKYLKEEKEAFDRNGFEWFFSDLNK